MRSFILLTFLFLGLGYYQLSGGNDFQPETRQVVNQAPWEAAPAAVVTRADTADAADLNALPVAAQPLVAATEETAADVAAVAEAITAALAAPAPEVPAEEAPVLASLAAPEADWRSVDASSLNMRSGPSTSDGVVAQLDRNDQVQVLSELDDGWALIRVATTGAEGWVATRFLAR